MRLHNIIRKIAGTYYLTQHVGIGLTSAVIITSATILYLEINFVQIYILKSIGLLEIL